MTSVKMIESNRRNSRLSTGPRTAPGKNRSRLNAMKHGAYSKKVLTPDEHDTELARLESDYVAHYHPASELELRDVRQLAILDWRLQRYGRMEAEILEFHGYEREHENGNETFEYGGAGWAMTHDCTKSRSIQAVSQVENRLRRQFLTLKAQLDLKLERRLKEGVLLYPIGVTNMGGASN